MISRIREKVFGFCGRPIRFRFNGSRNQIDEFEGIILRCYNNVFLIESNGLNRSFSYSDVLTGVLELDI